MVSCTRLVRPALALLLVIKSSVARMGSKNAMLVPPEDEIFWGRELMMWSSMSMSMGPPTPPTTPSPTPPTPMADCDTVVVDSNSRIDETSLQLNGNNPVISYQDSTNGNLKLAVCRDPTCSPSMTTIHTVDGGDSVNFVGGYSSLQLNDGSNPVISYFDVVNQSLKLAICGDPTCSPSTRTIRTVDGDGVGQFTSLQLNGSSNPVISYLDFNNGNLKVAVCGDPTCSPSMTTIRTVDGDSTDYVGIYTSLQLNGNNPVISYYDATNENLKLAVCRDPTCSPSMTTIHTVDGDSANVGLFVSLQLNDSANPVISYCDYTNLYLKLAVCGDPTCSPSMTTIRVVDGGFFGMFTSLQLNGSGNPVISYYDYTNGNLKLAVCGDPTCSPSTTTIRVVDSPDVGRYLSLQLDDSGNPVISYSASLTLKLATCSI